MKMIYIHIDIYISAKIIHIYIMVISKYIKVTHPDAKSERCTYQT